MYYWLPNDQAALNPWIPKVLPTSVLLFKKK